MDLKKENSNSLVKDFRTEADWIPVTPAKSSSSPISADMEEKPSNMTILTGISHESQQGVSFQNSSSTSIKEKKLAKQLQHRAVKSQLLGNDADFNIYNNFYKENVGKRDISFQDLLAMADAAAMGKKASGDKRERNSSFTSFSNVHMEDIQVGTSPADSQRENQDISQGEFQIMDCIAPEAQQCGQPIPTGQIVENEYYGDENGISSSITSFSNVHTEGIQVGKSPVSVLSENKDISLGGFQIMGCTIPEARQYASHCLIITPAWTKNLWTKQLSLYVMLDETDLPRGNGIIGLDDPSHGKQHFPTSQIFDLNSAPGTISEEFFSLSTPSQFAPVTPNHTKRLESRQVCDPLSSSKDEPANQEKEKENIESSPEKNCINLEEQEQILQEQSGDAVSIHLQENLSSEKGANEIANLNETPQQQKPRRRKHRPKVVIEGQPKRTRKPRTPKLDSPIGTPTGKRKYVRKKGVEKSTATPSEANETQNSNIVGETRKSCKRSINFDVENQIDEEKSSYTYEETLRTKVQSFVQLKQSMEVGVEKTDEGIAQMNQMLEGYLSIPENQANFTLTPNKSDLTSTESANNSLSVAYRKGKCRIHFSDETHDKEKITIESPNDSSCCTSAYMNEEKQARGRKRQHSGKTGQTEMSTFNHIGAQYNSCQAYQPIFLQYGASFPAMHIPAVYEKKKTETEQHLTTSSILSSVPAEKGHVRGMATGSFTVASGNQDEQQSFNNTIVCDHTIKLKKKRNKGLTRVQDLTSITGTSESKQWPNPIGAASSAMQEIKVSHQLNTCVENPVAAETHVKLATRKRTKRNSSSTPMPSVPFYHHQSASDTAGFPPHLIWNSVDLVNILIKQLEHLDINEQSSEVTNQEQVALIQYYARYQEKNALVLYQKDGTLVPFDNSFNQIRRRKPRPKVNLDDETTRVWMLLLEDINSEGIDGTDEEKARWWEEERSVFRGRADSFIARMHLVQGDRRFSRWKGSVVDSVVGVFLTQNVSDHLSSSAFMSLAARFPLKSERKHEPSNGVETSISVREPELSEVDPDENISEHEDKSNQSANEQSSVTVQDVEYSEEKEVANSDEFSRSNTIIFTSKDKLDCEALDMCGSDSTMSHDSALKRSDAQVSKPGASFMENHREADDILSSQSSVVSSQNSVDSSVAQSSEHITSCSYSGEVHATGFEPVNDGSTFIELIQIRETILLKDNDQERIDGPSNEIGQEKLEDKANSGVQNQEISTSCKPSSPSNYNLHLSDSGIPIIDCFDLMEEENTLSRVHQKSEEKRASEQSELSKESANQATFQEISSQSIAQSLIHINQNAQKDACQVQQVFDAAKISGEISDVTESTTMAGHLRKNENMASNASLNDQDSLQINVDARNEGTSKVKMVRSNKAKEKIVEWDSLRQQAQGNDGKTRGNTPYTMDSLDYEAVRCADVNEVADAIKERGMNNKLAERIQAFLNRLVGDHGSIDLEWLRDVPADKAKEYLLSFRGLGLKSVECVRLLCLHHLAFPVDTNVGRIAVRLGWVPLQPLPESLQLHLLELYPIMESIQKYLWPRLCKLDQRTLYELHYQMITFGKVFCTKSKPNCNACPMRGECRHFASAFASARLSLPAPEEKRIVTATEDKASVESPTGIINEQQLPLHAPLLLANQQTEQKFEATNREPVIEIPATPDPIIEVPTTPEQEKISNQEIDIEDSFGEDPDEIPTIKLNIEEFTQNLQNYIENNMELQDGDMSRALVELTREAASIPTPKLKNVSQLRTEHQVYELPDSHPLLKGIDIRERDDPSPYLLAIWTPGETADSIQPPAGQCSSQELGRLCDEETCFACSSMREAISQTVRGTILIPCRTAMRGSFPLNGTYFQVNEVFADHDSSLNPIDVPRSWLWNLPRRTVFFGTSIPTIFKGLTTEGIQYCFWRGFVCVRGFEQRTRAPRPLIARLHFPASRLTKTRGRMDERAL